MLSIKYGGVDVTQLAVKQCIQDTFLCLPSSDKRVEVFGDHAFGILKPLIINDKILNDEEYKMDICGLEIKEPPIQISILYTGGSISEDITVKALTMCTNDTGILFIPAGDCQRAQIFGDPIFGTLKHIHIIYNGESRIYTHKDTIKLNVTNAEHMYPKKKLDYIHSKLKFLNGNLKDEYPEQIMSVMFIQPECKVIELGSNVGRNTLVIASLLRHEHTLVTLECNPLIYDQLLINRDINECKFKTENAALSYRPILLKGWNSIPSDIPISGYEEVKTITWEQLQTKHDIIFDTLVADCEGALYYILLDNPHILNNIKLAILENDYHEIDKKNYIDDVLRGKGLSCIYSQGGGWGPCKDNFYEVWKRI